MRLPVCMLALAGGPDAAAAAQCFAIDPHCDNKVPSPCHACHAHVRVTPRPSTHSCGASFFPPFRGSFLGALLPQVHWLHLIHPDRHDIAFMLWWLRWETPTPVQLCCHPTTQPPFHSPSVPTPCGAAPLRKRAHDTPFHFPFHSRGRPLFQILQQVFGLCEKRGSACRSCLVCWSVWSGHSQDDAGAAMRSAGLIAGPAWFLLFVYKQTN